MRVIKKSEVREIIIGHVELTLIFLFDDFLCKIAILEPLKVRFLDKKQKLLSDDGTNNKGNGVNFFCLRNPEIPITHQKNAIHILFMLYTLSRMRRVGR